MKTIKSLLFLVLAGMSSTGWARTIEMDVNGLVCAFCAQGIEKTFKAFPEVDGVFVSLEHRLVAVSLKDGKDVGDARLRKAVTNAGYAVVAIRRTDESLQAVKTRVLAAKTKPGSAAPGHTHEDAGGDAHDHG